MSFDSNFMLHIDEEVPQDEVIYIQEVKVWFVCAASDAIPRKLRIEVKLKHQIQSHHRSYGGVVVITLPVGGIHGSPILFKLGELILYEWLQILILEALI